MSRETVLITGASSGIGRELARRFAADHSDLVLVARSQDKLEALAEEIRSEHGGEARVLAKDLAVRESPGEIRQELEAAGVAVDVLVNNAGFGAVGPMAELDLERQMAMVQVNVAAATHLTRLFLPGMIGRDRGGILNVASTAGFQPGPGMAVYFATKAYLLSLTEALAEELRKTSLHVTCLAPGPTATGFGADSGMERSRLFRMGTMDAATVAAAGHRGFRRGKVLVVPGIQNRMVPLSVRFGPRRLVTKITKWLIR
jgi:short-subunit dehydrogenase